MVRHQLCLLSCVNSRGSAGKVLGGMFPDSAVSLVTVSLGVDPDSGPRLVGGSSIIEVFPCNKPGPYQGGLVLGGSSLGRVVGGGGRG